MDAEDDKETGERMNKNVEAVVRDGKYGAKGGARDADDAGADRKLRDGASMDTVPMNGIVLEGPGGVKKRHYSRKRHVPRGGERLTG